MGAEEHVAHLLARRNGLAHARVARWHKLGRQRGLEEQLRALEALQAKRDHLAIGELVILLDVGVGGGVLHLLVVVESEAAELLLDFAHDLALGPGPEIVAPPPQQRQHPSSHVFAADGQPLRDELGKGIAIPDRHAVRDPAGFEYAAWRQGMRSLCVDRCTPTVSLCVRRDGA